MESNGSYNLTIWRTEMERTPRGIYTAEFRAEAVKLVETTGASVARAAKQLSIPKSSLANWVRASREGNLSGVGREQRPRASLRLSLRGLARN
jgi:transposase